MARIRTIKPKFWDDVKIGKISRDARLLYIGLWTFSDDLGVVISDPIWLKSKIFPYDQIQIQQFEKWIEELLIHGFISLLSYKKDGFYYLPNFNRHQVINKPNVDDVNMPKDILTSILNHIKDQSRNDTGSIPDISCPILGEEKEYIISLNASTHVCDRLAKMYASLLSDQMWNEPLMMNNHITPDLLKEYLVCFFGKLQNEAQYNISEQEAKQYFPRWLTTELSKKQKGGTNGRNKGGKTGDHPSKYGED